MFFNEEEYDLNSDVFNLMHDEIINDYDHEIYEELLNTISTLIGPNELVYIEQNGSFIWQDLYHNDNLVRLELFQEDDDDYSIWLETFYSYYSNATSEILEYSFDQISENNSQIVLQENLIEDFFTIERNPITTQDLRYYSSREMGIDQIGQLSAYDFTNEEIIFSQEDLLESQANFNEWINFDSI